jgi:ribosomal protein S18 acetylase RimI-like enzyme
VVVDSCFFSPLIPYQSVTTDSNIGSAPVIIRTVELKDLKGLADVLTHSFHPPQGFLYWIHPLLKLGIYEDLRSRLRSGSPHYRCLVASRLINPVSDGKEEIVGTVEISLRCSGSWLMGSRDRPYISNLAVSNAYRRQGIARKLLLKCEQVALEWGFPEISLHVLDDNERAKHLYFSSGYRLHRIESSLGSWFLNSPKRLLLNKRVLTYSLENILS